MPVEYDAGAGIIETAFRLNSTVVVAVFGKTEFYLLLFIHLVISASFKLKYFDPGPLHLELAMGLTGITGSLMTFFVVFYNGNVFARYNQLYVLTKNMNELCLYAASIFTREIKCQDLQRKLSRMLLASAFLFFFERTQSTDGNVSEAEWTQITNLGLINAKECELLKAHCKKLGRHCAMPSFMLIQWSMRLYRTKSPKLNELEKTYWGIRKCQDDVVELMELPMPFQYFHIMNLMLCLNLTLWSYSLALEDSYFASVIFLFVQLVFQGIRELSVALADPYGDDDADFPLDDWMTQLYVRVNSLVEDSFDPTTHSAYGHVAPLKPIRPGSQVIDLLVDLDEKGPRVKQKRELEEHTMDEHSDADFDKSPEPADKKGTYVAVSQTDTSKKDEEEEEEEDDDE